MKAELGADQVTMVVVQCPSSLGIEELEADECRPWKCGNAWHKALSQFSSASRVGVGRSSGVAPLGSKISRTRRWMTSYLTRLDRLNVLV